MEKITIYNTELDVDSLYNDYKDIQEELGNPIGKKDSREFEEWLNDFSSDNYFFFKEMIEDSEYNEPMAIILGITGGWRGDREIVPENCDSLLDAINLCSRNVDDIEIAVTEDYFEVIAMHHDGTNYFKIYLLSDVGLQAQYIDEDNFDVTKDENHIKIDVNKF